MKSTPLFIVGSRKEPTCGRDDCDVSEQPEHWVDIDLTDKIKAALKKVLEYLDEHESDNFDEAIADGCPAHKHIYHQVKILQPLVYDMAGHCPKCDTLRDSPADEKKCHKCGSKRKPIQKPV